jgi:hypothetical protein
MKTGVPPNAKIPTLSTMAGTNDDDRKGVRPHAPTDPQLIDHFWSRNYGDADPIAHTLRDRHPDRWIRFHSLPAAKRYAETPAEWDTLLDRQNQVIDNLAMRGQPIVLLTSTWGFSATPAGAAANLLNLGLPVTPWRSVLESDDPWPVFLQLHHSTIDWQPGVLDHLIRLVADDHLRNVMLFQPDADWLIHPYDGGMDVILGNSADRDALAQTYNSWRSDRADGM